MEPYHDLLGKIHRYLQPRTYLEVGVSAGWSMAKTLPTTLCVGIDPSPQQINTPFHDNVTIYEGTSDQFFAYSSQFDAGGLDLAFIDGMHNFEYALRDFMGIESLSNPHTVVLVHDCLPVSEVTSTRTRMTDFWSGDIWRLILVLKKYRPDLKVTTLDVGPTGLGVIVGLDSNNTVLQENYDNIVREYLEIQYYVLDMLGKEDLLNVAPATDWIDALDYGGV